MFFLVSKPQIISVTELVNSVHVDGDRSPIWHFKKWGSFTYIPPKQEAKQIIPQELMRRYVISSDVAELHQQTVQLEIDTGSSLKQLRQCFKLW